MSLTMRYSLKSMILVLLSLLMSCRTYVPTSEELIYTLISKTYSSKERLYYKSLEEPELQKFIKKTNLKLWNNNLSRGLVTGGKVDYDDILSKEDLHFISDQLEHQEQMKLDPKLVTDKELLTKTKAVGVHKISQPVFNKDRTFSFIFRKKFNGGEDIVVYELANNEWRVHSVITLSIV